MTDIDKLTAGPELDALVAEKVMWWRRVGPNKWFYRQLTGVSERGVHEELVEIELTDGSPAPKFSTDIAAAWEVVEKLRKDGTKLGIFPARNGYDVEYFPGHFMSADTAPLAICRAALKVVEA